MPDVIEMPRLWSLEDGIYCAETDTFAYYENVRETFPVLANGFSTYKFMEKHEFATAYFIENDAVTPRRRNGKAAVDMLESGPLMTGLFYPRQHQHKTNGLDRLVVCPPAFTTEGRACAWAKPSAATVDYGKGRGGGKGEEDVSEGRRRARSSMPKCLPELTAERSAAPARRREEPVAGERRRGVLWCGRVCVNDECVWPCG